MELDNDQIPEAERIDLNFGGEAVPEEYDFSNFNTFGERENAGLIKQYGNIVYNQNKNWENITCFPLNFLKRNKITTKFR